METIIIFIFFIGYVCIAFESTLKINKAAIAIFTGVLSWTVYILHFPNKEEVIQQLNHHLGDISGILFFLLSAMTIVEIIDAHDGFRIITDKIKTKNAVKLVWIIAIVTFFLSAVLDNLTTTIVVISLIRKIIQDKEKKLLFVGITIIAANAGGAWSPIGDVTTTMLWIGGQVSALGVMKHLIIPSILCLMVPLVIISKSLKGVILQTPLKEEINTGNTTPLERNLVFITGIGGLIFVPIFKTITHLPPFMAILMALGVLWITTEIIHKNKYSEHKNILSVANALQKIDTPSILFFLGILLSISCLQSTQILLHVSNWLNNMIGNNSAIAIVIGLLSAVVDNVPLVAATQGMYTLQQFACDHSFWHFLAFSTGTGGSILIIGSAAGVAAMGLENISFFWYFKNITFLALIGYIVGCVAHLIIN